MTTSSSLPQGPDELRRRAEARLSRIVQQSVPSLAPESVQTLVHELRVHQIELELQVQEVRRAQAETEESRNRYRELYESIPVGYATIDHTGHLHDVNPAGSALLKLPVESGRLPNFYAFFADRDADRFTRFCRGLPANGQPGICEITMRRSDGSSFVASLEGLPVRSGEGAGDRLRITFQDITARKSAEAALEANRLELQSLTGQLFTAQEDERRRIAQDLHDDHCQRLTVAIMEVTSLAKVYGHMNPPLEPRLQSLRGKLSDVLDDFRHLSHTLLPRHLDCVSLSVSMRQHVAEFAQHTGLRMTFRDEAVPDELPMPVTICLYRLLQESLHNVWKHAKATEVLVALSGVGGRIELVVTDNGQGFDRNEGATGIGLRGMRERVRPLGGDVRIDSRAGKGTAVTVSVPLRTAAP